MKSHHNKAHYSAVATAGSGHILHTNDWSDFHIMAHNFEQLMGPIPCHKLSVLDCGAGSGELVHYLRDVRQSTPVHYTGIDVSPLAVEHAQNQFPERTFLEQDLLDYMPETAPDWVIMSGVMTILEQEHAHHVRDMIAKAYALARVGVGFNMLSDQLLSVNQYYQLDNTRYYANDSEVATYCTELAPRIIQQHSLDRSCFTIHMLKESDTPLNTDFGHLPRLAALIDAQEQGISPIAQNLLNARNLAWEAVVRDKTPLSLDAYRTLLTDALRGNSPTQISQFIDGKTPDKVLISEMLNTVLDHAIALVSTAEFEHAVDLLPCEHLRVYFLAHRHIAQQEFASIKEALEPVLTHYPNFQRAKALHQFCMNQLSHGA